MSQNKTEHYDVIIIGGGAAGLMCAATAASRGRRVKVIDHSNKVGKKILMSGGGRCNFTNMYVENEHYLSKNPHFFKSALSRFTQWDFIGLVNKYQLAYHEKTKGQLFCDHKSADILNILLSECEQHGAQISTHCNILDITFDKEKYRLSTNQGGLSCDALVVATGGLSIPTMGASGFGYDIAKQFKLKVTAKYASLVPFTLDKQILKHSATLSGLSLNVTASCNNQSFSDPLLFTHRGLSGPAILQISNYWHPNETVVIDFLPNASISELIYQKQQNGERLEFKNAFAEYFPKRFSELWLDKILNIPNKPVNQYSEKEIAALEEGLHKWSLVPKGTEGYRTAEVTMGGVDTDEISSKTFESKKQPGLYFIGEVLDVTGWLGGYNFQWAWASGWCAGQHI